MADSIEKTVFYQELRSRKEGEFIAQINGTFERCKNILPSVNRVFNNLNVNKLVMNSRHKDLIPNVTRNDFSDTIKNELSYAVGKAILCGFQIIMN